tara:strand:- start:7 stop:474 length:468 start_codon:yes stop_codon:yes gene_type:complete
MFTDTSITKENSEKIVVTGRGDGGIIFFVCLFGIAFLLWITLKLDAEVWIFTILICVGLGLLALFLFFQPDKIISEFDLNKRKFFITKTHFILNFSTEEIRFEDIESIESEYNGSTRKTHLIVNLKDQPFGKDLGTVRCAEKLQEKLKQFIGLPD